MTQTLAPKVSIEEGSPSLGSYRDHLLRGQDLIIFATDLMMDVALGGDAPRSWEMRNGAMEGLLVNGQPLPDPTTPEAAIAKETTLISI